MHLPICYHQSHVMREHADYNYIIIILQEPQKTRNISFPKKYGMIHLNFVSTSILVLLLPSVIFKNNKL